MLIESKMNKLRGLLFCFLISYALGYWEFRDTAPSPKWIGASKRVQVEALKGLEAVDKNVIRTHPGLKPVLYFRKKFSFKEPVATAEVLISAKGVFQG